jgi:hypothetical protein
VLVLGSLALLLKSAVLVAAGAWALTAQRASVTCAMDSPANWGFDVSGPIGDGNG